MNNRSIFSAFSAVVLGFSAAMAQVLPPPDAQGWIKVFRGSQDAANFYTFYQSGVRPAQARQAFPDATFRIRGDTVDVSGTPTGHLMYRIPFSHYRVRYQMRFPGTTGNCGMLLHIQENDVPAGVFPRSVEAQGDPGQGMGQFWAIGDVWVNVTVTGVSNGFPRFNAAGRDTVYGGRDWNSRCVPGKDGWGQPSYTTLANLGGGWVTQEGYVYGRDSIVVRVADTVRIKYRLPRVSSGGTPNNVSKYLDKGLVAWQSEGRNVWYRNLQIMLLPGDSLYNPTYVEFNRRNRITPPPPRKLILRGGVLVFGNGTEDPLFDAVGRAQPAVLPISAFRK